MEVFLRNIASAFRNVDKSSVDIHRFETCDNLLVL